MVSRVVSRGAAGMVGALALTAAPLMAQGPGVFEIFASRQQSPSTPLLGGISFGSYHGAVGMRVSGALNLTSGQDSAPSRSPYAATCHHYGCESGSPRGYYREDGLSMMPSIGAWSADLDLVFAPVRPVPALRALLLGFSPYAFAGVGGYGVRPANAADTSNATWSVGAGAHHELLGWLGVGAEARYRQPFRSDSAFAPAWQDKLQYRVGLTVSFGGRKRTPEVVVATPAPAASAPCERAPCPVDDAAAQRVLDPRFASRIVDFADGYVGTQYATGGSSPRTGFDAPGFVRFVFGEQGLRLPATVDGMATVGTEVPTRAGSLRPGDLLFFSNDRSSTVDHVAIYVGRDRIIHSTASGNGVRYDVLGEGERGQWFADHLVSARRVISDAGTRDGAPRPQGEGDDR
ncbi:MAG: C40 family peptidase [Gemmatimonadaceae bacterium]|nr:C40 family peptidase [Gemmatimonadaceae bacterium]NUQ91738.1 C40 family peptidase [Gemmatimonadaceae bacterium]NUR18764.1 C40 family peptidase [Gemmatimonadaceae bacterium]NUS97770.1 C40 family peptidase [Gemmatimonadaceae bacterium]